MECNYAPYNWTQNTETEFTVKTSSVDYCDGYDVQIAKKIAAEMNKELVVKAISWDGLIPALQNDTIEALIGGMTDTEERRQSVSFSQPYYASEMVIVVPKDSPYANITNIQELTNAKVVGQADTLYDEVIDQIEGVNHLTPQESFTRAILSVTSGEADALVGELPAAKGAITSDSNLVIVRFNEENGFKADTTVSVAVKKDNTELVDQINSILENISSDDRTQLMVEAGERQPASE